MNWKTLLGWVLVALACLGAFVSFTLVTFAGLQVNVFLYFLIVSIIVAIIAFHILGSATRSANDVANQILVRERHEKRLQKKQQ